MIYLAQSDTTVGFLSQNPVSLANIKKRTLKKPFVRCVNSLHTLSQFVRVPIKYKNRVRRSHKTTFVIKNQALRVVQNNPHKEFLDMHKWMYSSSANESTQEYQESFAMANADIVLQDKRGLFEDNPSSIYKLSKTRIKKLR